jgi:lipoate-protein ligase A
MKSINCVNLRGKSIFDQLCVEEILLRHSNQNWYLFNHNCVKTSIVVGFSGKIKELINLKLIKDKNIAIIRRFTGGGTVIVDENTLFSSFILNVRKLNNLLN